jgi:hypothetical protein
MNNVGNALLSNSGSGINSIGSTTNSLGVWILVAGILLLLVLAYMFYQNQLTPEKTPRDWRNENAGFGENWCFVGEDVTGRWCVKVPQPDACSPERLFSSRPGCELVPASPLPLGLVAKGGATTKPLAASHTK